jgi:hypothetical protein
MVKNDTKLQINVVEQQHQIIQHKLYLLSKTLLTKHKQKLSHKKTCDEIIESNLNFKLELNKI